MQWKESNYPAKTQKGWASGDYLCQCRKCQDRFMGDKRASVCADCAYEEDGPRAMAEGDL
jgi:hypothetical protein